MYNSNLPEVKLGIVAVSRNCFPKELSYTRCKAVVDEYGKYGNIFRVEDVVENEKDVYKRQVSRPGNGNQRCG